MDSAAPRHVVIVGAGFAGLYAAKKLRGEPVRVTVLDRTNHHVFQPLLYQVATAVLNPSDIAVPIRHVVRAANVSVLLADVTAIDVERKVVVCGHGDVAYDTVIVAAGVGQSYFGHDDWAARAPGLKTIGDALEIRRRILSAFEMAERETDPETRQAWLTFVVVGGGPTGVELAGALAEIAKHTLPGEFQRIDPSLARVVLVEGQRRLLGALPDELGAEAAHTLAGLGVEVRTNAIVTSVDDRGVTLGGPRIAARTVLWAAGVQASPLAQSLGVPLDRAGRVKVTSTLTLPGRDDVFVAGDLASVEQRDGDTTTTVPGLAPAAMQEGRHAAENVLRHVRGLPMKDFHYRDKGSFAVIGRGAAVGVAFRKVKMHGLSAWLVWIFVHLAYLIGFRNRLSVLAEWAHSFFTYKRRARLITGGVDGLGSKPTPGAQAPEG